MVGSGEVDHLLALLTDRVVVRLTLVLKERLVSGEMEFLYDTFAHKFIQVAVDGGEVKVGEFGM